MQQVAHQALVPTTADKQSSAHVRRCLIKMPMKFKKSMLGCVEQDECSGMERSDPARQHSADGATGPGDQDATPLVKLSVRGSLRRVWPFRQ